MNLTPAGEGPGKDGTMRIGLTSIYVDDQDQAEQFSTEILGFQVHTSTPYPPTSAG
jgi:catechol 2,3-dioxygenase-like lactoylglutathione lyase family enzyme